MRFAPTLSEQALLNELPAVGRLEYAVSRIFECEEVWGLGDENGWLIRDVDDKAVISIWPYRQMAQECAQGDWSGCSAISVSLEHFLYTLLKQCQNSAITLEVCPAPGSAGYQLPATALYEMLENMVESGSYFIEG